MARHAVRQVDDSGNSVFVGGGEIGNVDAGLGPTQSRRERNEQHRRQIVTRVEVARIAHLAKNGDQRLQYRLPFESGSLFRINFSFKRNSPLLIRDSPADRS